MSNLSPGTPGDPAEGLLDAWNLAEGPGGGADAQDSLLGYIRARSRPPLGSVAAGAAGGRALFGKRNERDTEIHFAFNPGGEDEPAGSEAGSDPARKANEAAIAPRGPAGPRTESLPITLPRAGEMFGGFLIVGELGRGAFARVYLARQEDLGHRLVALKVSRAEGDEPQILARLQHSHIVPIHSVHDDPRTGLRMICMPFLGGANLAQVLEAAGARLPEQASGRSLVEALDVVSNRLQSTTGLEAFPPSIGAASLGSKPPTIGHRSGILSLGPILDHGAGSFGTIQSLWTRLSGRGRAELIATPRLDEAEVAQPARQFLREANFIQAAAWIVARLAEGLDHAHSRGLLHRDLKPSNILIAGDGTPMLLDFNLATLSRLPDLEEGSRALLGGTLPYMAPEHLDAFHPRGTTPPEAVREPADLYALGLILFEMIAGEHPFPEPEPGPSVLATIRSMIERRRRPPSLRAACPEVPWSLDAVVARCLDPDPGRRYARARDLAEDLRRFLDDLPLKHAPEPSLRERAAKWARRNPQVRSTTTIALLSVVLLLAAGGIIGLLSSSVQGLSARLRYRTFQSAFAECQFLLNTSSGPVEHLGRGVELTRRTIERQGVGDWGPSTSSSWVRWLTPREQLLLREQAAELILLEARARVALAGKHGSEADRRQALEWAVDWLDRAERIDPKPTAALFGERARYLAALGLADRAARDRRREAEARLVDGRDFALAGTALVVRGDWERGEETLRRAVTLDPQRFWAWFALGQCHFEQGRVLEAAGDFGVCTALEPKFAWPYMNRGLALARAGRLAEARMLYDQALAANPKFAEAWVNRALACLELNDLPGAEDGLRRALALGRKEPGILAALGEVQARLGRRDEAEQLFATVLDEDPENATYRVARAAFRLESDPAKARADLDRVLERSPRNPRALTLMARLSRRDDPRAALRFVDAALEADPELLDALELRALIRARLGDLAAIDDAERLARNPTAHRLYNAACSLAILSGTAGDPRLEARALAFLGRALDAGFPPSEAVGDADWTPFRERREFRGLIARADGSRPPQPGRSGDPRPGGASAKKAL